MQKRLYSYARSCHYKDITHLFYNEKQVYMAYLYVKF